MKFIARAARCMLTVGIATTGIVLGACAPDPTGEAELTSAEAGAGVFARNCAACHESGRAPTLANIKALPVAERADRIRQHPRAGVIPERLTAAQLGDIVTFLRSDMPTSGTGEQTFAEQCGACHGGGRGPELAEVRSLAPSDVEGRIRNHPEAGMVPQRLPAAQLADLIAFFEAG